VTDGTAITEPSRKIPVEASYDVAVVGGGIAGVAAALAAAREGVEVVLLERTFGLGGLATLGNVIMYLPLCDGMGRLLKVFSMGVRTLSSSPVGAFPDLVKQPLEIIFGLLHRIRVVGRLRSR